jgi:DeoR/GlpR family transcriptional regulator of sugar metabolism
VTDDGRVGKVEAPLLENLHSAFKRAMTVKTSAVVPIKQSMIAAAGRRILSVSKTKFPGTGALRLCSLTDVDVVITTAGANKQTLKVCRDAGGEVIIA